MTYPVRVGPAVPQGPSPYVSVHMSRKNAERALMAVRRMATGRAKSNPLWAIIKNLENALAENCGDDG